MTENKLETRDTTNKNLIDIDGKLLSGEYIFKHFGDLDKGWTVWKIRKPGFRSKLLEEVTLSRLVKRILMTPAEVEEMHLDRILPGPKTEIV